ncbi:TraR/DksA family transcriptional regulator [Streptomyces typhae]|uniref:TraR/DksA family transcriptional regulator n=1 Tax=Streptomyces typhae TaxID=2681492 RepID=UPI003CCE2F3E
MAATKAGATETAATETAATETATTTKATTTKTAATKATTTKAAAKKSGTAKSAKAAVTAKKAAAKKSAAKETAAKESAPGKSVATKAVAGEVEGGVSASKKATGAAKGPGAGKRTARKTAASAADGAAQAAETTGATTVVAKKTPGTATAAKKPDAVPKARAAAAAPGELAVRPGEDPWTPAEVAEARTELMAETMRLRTEIEASETSLAGLMRDSGDGAGDDQADTGTKNITREHEMALAANAREMLEQTERALERLDAGTYGLCENCGNPIGKARMQAFPRATLCVECKQKQERRY